MGAQVNDSDLLREAMALLAVFEDQVYDPHKDLYCISGRAWKDMTRNFRERIDTERHLRLGPFTPQRRP